MNPAAVHHGMLTAPSRVCVVQVALPALSWCLQWPWHGHHSAPPILLCCSAPSLGLACGDTDVLCTVSIQQSRQLLPAISSLNTAERVLNIALIYDCQHKYLEHNWTVCPFSKTTGFPPFNFFKLRLREFYILYIYICLYENYHVWIMMYQYKCEVEKTRRSPARIF